MRTEREKTLLLQKDARNFSFYLHFDELLFYAFTMITQNATR